jgi:hypothetical protein
MVPGLRCLVGVVVSAVVLAGCGVLSDEPLPGQPMDAPPGWLASPVWHSDGWVYVLRPDRAGHVARTPTTELWRVHPEGGSELLDVSGPPECQVTRYGSLHGLPDGRLGLLRQCSPPLEQDDVEARRDLVAYDPVDGSVEELVRLPRGGFSTVTWLGDMSGGFVDHRGSTCPGLAPFDREGLARFDGPLTVDGRTWRLDESVHVTVGRDCSGDGKARTPWMLPGGELLFVAAPGAQGRSGAARDRARWGLYEWVPDGGQEPRRVVSGFTRLGGVESVLADGSVLVNATWRGRDGVHRVELDTGAVRLVQRGPVAGFVVSPDGTRAAVVFREPGVPFPDDAFHHVMRLVDFSLADVA